MILITYVFGQEYSKAIDCYQKYLDLAVKLGDVEGEALAYNFMACSIQECEDQKLEALEHESSGSYKISDAAILEVIKKLITTPLEG